MSEEKILTREEKKVRRDLWKTFYEKEREFLGWLNGKAKVLLDIKASSPMFDDLGEAANFGYERYTLPSGRMNTRPPRFIRKIIEFSDESDLVKCKEIFSDVRLAFNAASTFMNEKEVTYPHRFPMFFDDVSQINYTFDEAFSAHLLKNEGRFVLYSGFFDKELLTNIKATMTKAGFESLLLEVGSSGLSMTASIDITELREHWHCCEDTAIHMRKHTGTQYTCRVNFNDTESMPQRCKFGLIVLGLNSKSCSIHRALPRKKRRDNLESIGTEVYLPLDLGVRFFLT